MLVSFLTDLEKRVEEFETMQSCSLLQVTGDGKEWAFVNEETSIKLSFPSRGTKSISLPLKHFSCQLTDPLKEEVPCSITSTQSEVCTVRYTPTIRGPHQLKLTGRLSRIRDKQKKKKKKRRKKIVTSDRGIRTRVAQMQDERSTD